MGRNEWIVGTAYALRASIFILLFGERLTPDSGLYASGRSSLAWASSPVCSLAGFVAGYEGVSVVGIVGAFALGAIVVRYSGDVPSALFLGITPPGWYLIQPSADGIGSASALIALRNPRRRWLFLAVCLFHAEAGLVVLFSNISARFVVSKSELYSSNNPPRLDEWTQRGILALLAGMLACLFLWHIQIRYLLPGLALALTASSVTSFLRSITRSIQWRRILGLPSPNSSYSSRA